MNLFFLDLQFQLFLMYRPPSPMHCEPKRLNESRLPERAVTPAFQPSPGIKAWAKGILGQEGSGLSSS